MDFKNTHSPANAHSNINVSADKTAAGLLRGADGSVRCFWAGHDPLYQHYHDTEWGIPTDGDRKIFENLCLEGFQAGLSWLTILRKREDFRAAFADFDLYLLAACNAEQQTELLIQNSNIIRHRGKIAAVFANARAAASLIAEYGSLHAYLRQFLPSPPFCSAQKHSSDSPAVTQTPASALMAKSLKKHGFRFIGSTTAYAFMQAIGMVNDHNIGCCCRIATQAAQDNFYRVHA